MSKGGPETPSAAKRRSTQLDFSNLGPLKTTGTVGFTAFRDSDGDGTRQRKARKKSNGNVMQDDSEDEDDDDDLLGKMQDVDEKDTTHLAPDDAGFSGELADGVDRMKVGLTIDICTCIKLRHLLTRPHYSLSAHIRSNRTLPPRRATRQAPQRGPVASSPL